MEYVIGFIVSAFVGFASVFIFKKHNLNGELKITETNEKDFYTLYVDNLEKMLRRRYLLLKINKPTRK